MIFRGEILTIDKETIDNVKRVWSSSKGQYQEQVGDFLLIYGSSEIAKARRIRFSDPENKLHVDIVEGYEDLLVKDGSETSISSLRDFAKKYGKTKGQIMLDLRNFMYTLR